MALTLNKQTVNFVLDQGATFEKTITAKNTAGGNVSISSGSTAAKLRQSTYSGNNIHTFSTSVSGSNVTISMAATNTANVSADRRYVYDIEFTQSDATTVERLAEGIVTISPQSTAGDIIAGGVEEEVVSAEVISDGQWGSTYWTDYVRNDGAKDRLVTNATDVASPYWGENGEDHWWEMDGPHHEDILEMKTVILAEGTYTSHAAWNQALIRLVGTPNTYNTNTSTWSTGSYSALADGEARTGKPFTVTSTFSTNFTKITNLDQTIEPNGTVWAVSPKHYGNNKGGGFRLQQFKGQLIFQIGHMSRNTGNYNRVDGYLKPIFGVSANTKTWTNTPSNVYQDSFENAEDNSTTTYQTMNPYDVTEDVRMWYQITCVYNGGPVGYYKTSTLSETEAELVQNIKDSFKFYQTNLRTGKVHEIDWHHVQMSNKEDYLGFIQGVGYEGDREADTRFGAFCDGAANAYVFEGNWAGTWVTNQALGWNDIQGNVNRINGFAMDPLGWATKNNKDATNTWIWSPSHHPDRLEDTSENTKDPYPNITSGAADSNYLKAQGSMDDEDYFRTQADNSYWANNYPLDTA